MCLGNVMAHIYKLVFFFKSVTKYYENDYGASDK